MEPNSVAGITVDLPAGTPSDVIGMGVRSGLQYTRITEQMADALEELELETFPTADPEFLYNAQELRQLAVEFPEGTFIGFDGPTRKYPVSCGLGVRVHFDLAHSQHNAKAIFEDSATGSGHHPDGPWYYGTDIVVRPSYRRRGIGNELYELRKGVCRQLNLRGIVAGGAIPGFADHKHAMSADDYVAAVVRGDLYDPTLTFQLENGFEAPAALANYIPDPRTDGWWSLIIWHSPTYRQLTSRTGDQ